LASKKGIKNRGGYYMKKLMAWFKNEDGQGMVEYGLIIGLIAIVVIVVLAALGGKIRDLFQQVDDAMPTAAATTTAP